MRRLGFIALGAEAMLAGPAFAADHVVNIKGMAFSPASLTIAVGDTVTFVNGDGVTHTATAGDGAFDTGRLAPGKSATVKIAAGTHTYKCSIHASMQGTIIVK